MKTPETPTQSRLPKSSKTLLATIALSATLFFNSASLRASDKPIEKKDDATITHQIKESLLFHLQLDTKTETRAGVVTLSGSAGSAAEKDLNSKIASEIIGVKNVLNQMTIPVTLAGNN